MAKPINIVLTICDGKTPVANFAQILINVVNQDTQPDISAQMEMARRFQIDVDSMTGGKIVSCGLIIDVPLDASVKTIADINSDTESGATFIFRGSTGHETQFRIPTFNENLFTTGYPDVDISNPIVQSFLDNIIMGYDSDPAGSGLRLDVTDSRGDDVVVFLRGLKSFQKSRV